MYEKFYRLGWLGKEGNPPPRDNSPSYKQGLSRQFFAGNVKFSRPSTNINQMTRMFLLYKQQWNTRWAFPRKHDIFTRENNMLSSHVKISPLLRLHNESRLSQQKWKALVFIGVYRTNRILHGRLEILNFSSRVEKYFIRSLRSLLKYCSTLEEKFRISARSCNILYKIFKAYNHEIDTQASLRLSKTMICG